MRRLVGARASVVVDQLRAVNGRNNGVPELIGDLTNLTSLYLFDSELGSRAGQSLPENLGDLKALELLRIEEANLVRPQSTCLGPPPPTRSVAVAVSCRFVSHLLSVCDPCSQDLVFVGERRALPIHLRHGRTVDLPSKGLNILCGYDDCASFRARTGHVLCM